MRSGVIFQGLKFGVKCSYLQVANSLKYVTFLQSLTLNLMHTELILKVFCSLPYPSKVR